MLLIRLAPNQQRQQTWGTTPLTEMVYLLLVMLVYKCLHRSNRGVNCAPPQQGR